MKIGLIDVDGHNFPNLPLMKISAHHKKIGDTVEWVNPLLHYDKIYMSKVFTFTDDFNFVLNADEIYRGGTGYDLKNKLPQCIEQQCPDYSIYPQFAKTAYGFITRGCPRGCKFCVVAEKEGKKSIQVADLSEFWRGQKKIKLLDPNLLACKDADMILKCLNDSNSHIDFTQGLDIRFMDDKKVYMLNKIKSDMIHFAWDNYEFKTYDKLKYFRSKLNYSERKLHVYVLTNFNTTHEQDLERIYKLRELKYDPYVMIYDKINAPLRTRQLQRWVNNKIIFHSCEKFENYMK